MSKGLKLISTDQDCYSAAIDRVRRIYDIADKVVVSFSGGKDSTCVLNTALQVAHERRRLPLDVYFIDEEVNYPETIEYMKRVQARDDVRLKWCCLPVTHRNACSRTVPYWVTWDPAKKDRWVYDLPDGCLREKDIPGFRMGMGLADVFPVVYGPENGNVVELLGIRTQESIRRLHTLLFKVQDNYITGGKGHVSKGKPVYDWKTEDVWVAAAVHGWDYNHAYDVMAMMGITPGLQRVTPPFGEEPLMGLWKFKQGWPGLWDKMLARVEGCNTAGLYALTDLYGSALKQPPAGMTWKEWVWSLIPLYPPDQQKQVAANIVNAIGRHTSKTNRPIPEDVDDRASGLSWKFIALMVARGDLKGRKIQTMTNRAMLAAKKTGLTKQEIESAEYEDGQIV